jgi:hypothetical protein
VACDNLLVASAPKRITLQEPGVAGAYELIEHPERNRLHIGRFGQATAARLPPADALVPANATVAAPSSCSSYTQLSEDTSVRTEAST